jgi:hypothetical protein
MSISATFGSDIGWTGRRATMRTIAAFVRANSPGHVGLQELFSETNQELRDAIGGWYLGDLSREDLLYFSLLLDKLESELPAPISDWNEEWRPRFLSDFARFRAMLKERIQQMARSE